MDRIESLAALIRLTKPWNLSHSCVRKAGALASEATRFPAWPNSPVDRDRQRARVRDDLELLLGAYFLAVENDQDGGEDEEGNNGGQQQDQGGSKESCAPAGAGVARPPCLVYRHRHDPGFLG
jgi:hypothetical protein